MEQYTVTGMSCAACGAKVEEAVAKVPGVTSYSVSLLANSMGIEGSASSQEVVKAVEAAEYGAAVKGETASKPSAGDTDNMLKDRETPVLKRRPYYSLESLIILMYFSMGHMMWNWPVPAFLADNHVAMGLLQLLLTGIVMVINQKFFISSFKGLIHRAPNMDTLVVLGPGASFVYSVYALLAMTDVQVNGDMAGVMSYMHEFYFEPAAMILTLITVGKMLEARSKGRAADALESLMKLAPETVTLKVDGMGAEVPVDQVKKGDIFMVQPGENIPVDGIMLEGSSAVNESALTRESIPMDKSVGDQVSAATMNQPGYIVCEASRMGEDTTLSRIIQVVSDAAATKAPIARMADRISRVFVSAVITIAAATMLVWLIAGESIGSALARGISVLIINCPCTLELTTPMTIMVGNGMGTKRGIMLKAAVPLEETGRMEIVAPDKTGTVTNGEPKVTGVIPAEGITERQLLELAFSLGKRSEHPLTKAVFMKARELGIQAQEVSDFKTLPGSGLSAVLENRLLCGDDFTFINNQIQVTEEMRTRSEQLAGEGKTPLFFSRDGVIAGIIAVADTTKEDSPQAVKELQSVGAHVAMLTGDNERTARAVGRQAGVDGMITGVLPDGKESVIRSLKEKSRMAMVGDGINDALALTGANIGIAIGAGTNTAIDAADVVLMRSRLRGIPAAIRMSRTTLRNMHENLLWASFYDTVGIPLAVGLWYPVSGWKLSSMFGAAVMSLSNFYIVTNTLRLNFFKMYDGSGNKKIKVRRKEEKKMVETMKIEGMMYGHCKARVKKYLEGLTQVEGVVISHEADTAVVTLNGPMDDSVLRKTVEGQDHKVLDIQ